MKSLLCSVTLAMALMAAQPCFSCGCMDGKTLLTQDGHAVTFTEDTTVSPSGGTMTLWYKGTAYKFLYSDADCPIIEIMSADGWRYYFSYGDMLLELSGNYMYSEH